MEKRQLLYNIVLYLKSCIIKCYIQIILLTESSTRSLTKGWGCQLITRVPSPWPAQPNPISPNWGGQARYHPCTNSCTRKISNFHPNKLRSSETMLSCPNLKHKICFILYKELFILFRAYLVVERKKGEKKHFFAIICIL